MGPLQIITYHAASGLEPGSFRSERELASVLRVSDAKDATASGAWSEHKIRVQVQVGPLQVIPQNAASGLEPGSVLIEEGHSTPLLRPNPPLSPAPALPPAHNPENFRGPLALR